MLRCYVIWAVFCRNVAAYFSSVLGYLFIVVFVVAAVHARGLLRVGCWLVVLSNVVWVAARKIGNWAMGGEVPTELRYDNDLYHFLLIGSTYVIFRAFARGAGS